MHAPGGSEPLPKVVYAVVEENLAPARVDDPLAQSFGFNSGAEWDAGEGDGRYLRWIRACAAAECSADRRRADGVGPLAPGRVRHG